MIGEPAQILTPVDVRVVQVQMRAGGAAERLVRVGQVVRERADRADRDRRGEQAGHGRHPEPADHHQSGRGDGEKIGMKIA
jgi:hypothetical protein